MVDEPKTQPEVATGGIGRQPPTRIGSAEMPPVRFICCICKQLAKECSQILPYMSAYICKKCEAEARYVSVPESQVANKVHAPWTDNQVGSLNDYQSSDGFLPLVCPLEHRLIAHPDGLHCSHCTNFSLPWAYPWMLDGSWNSVLGGGSD